MQLAANLQSMKAENADEAQKSIKELQMFLGKADPVARQVLFQDIESKSAISDLLKGMDSSNANAVVADLIKAKSGTPKFLDDLSAELIQLEIRPLNPDSGRGTALRQDSAATKLTTQYNKKSPSGQAFISQAIQPLLKAVAKIPGDLETDPDKIGGMSESKKQQAVVERAEKHKALVRETIDAFAKTPVPPDVAKISPRSTTNRWPSSRLPTAPATKNKP